jgi:7-cyano-7-deazaguanine synthase
MANEGAIILLSGGLDSSTLLFYLKKVLKIKPIFALTFLYGQKHSREIQSAIWQAKNANIPHKILDFSFFKELLGNSSALISRRVKIPNLEALPKKVLLQPPTYVPHRNLILLSLAASYAEANCVQNVFYGAQRQDAYSYWDCTSQFISALNNILKLNRKKPVKIKAPFVEWGKKKIIQLGLRLGVDYSHTWTCYVGRKVICGKCPSCVERLNAFAALNISDPLRFE